MKTQNQHLPYFWYADHIFYLLVKHIKAQVLDVRCEKENNFLAKFIQNVKILKKKKTERKRFNLIAYR